MKMRSAKGKISGLTLLEALVVIAVVAILAALALPSGGGPHSSYLSMCMSNQRQIELGLSLFKEDHSGEYPWQDSATNGGSLESVSGYQVSPHFRVLSEYQGKQTRIFICPTDKSRQEATDRAQLQNTNISYFINLNALTNSTSILTGDRHLEADGKAVNPGLFVYTTNATLNWTRELHGKVQSGPIGVLSFADGHVQIVKGKDLSSVFKNQPVATNHIIV
ncbi:MAG TPA: prepilin-type N-terminal cleavage/methylation domain-containing protein, partial [Verrucomicrobiae bacterium]|nr:prepilin-type N-terminal cleavage/methylation domain-containing protein [Verrucomicrobiae bacterium]